MFLDFNLWLYRYSMHGDYYEFESLTHSLFFDIICIDHYTNTKQFKYTHNNKNWTAPYR